MGWNRKSESLLPHRSFHTASRVCLRCSPQSFQIVSESMVGDVYGVSWPSGLIPLKKRSLSQFILAAEQDLRSRSTRLIPFLRSHGLHCNCRFHLPTPTPCSTSPALKINGRRKAVCANTSPRTSLAHVSAPRLQHGTRFCVFRTPTLLKGAARANVHRFNATKTRIAVISSNAPVQLPASPSSSSSLSLASGEVGAPFSHPPT